MKSKILAISLLILSSLTFLYAGNKADRPDPILLNVEAAVVKAENSNRLSVESPKVIQIIKNEQEFTNTIHAILAESDKEKDTPSWKKLLSMKNIYKTIKERQAKGDFQELNLNSIIKKYNVNDKILDATAMFFVYALRNNLP